MSDAGVPQHWLDRLAVRYTRRQALKAAIAGTALALPFVRATRAEADGPNPCQKGCLYTNHNNTVNKLDTCRQLGAAGYVAYAGTCWRRLGLCSLR